jgi:PIN domain
MEYIFVADTNLFFECKRLEDLPWDELGVDPICIALTKPVLAEIDKHKKGVGRTKKRAIETFNRVREMLDDEKEELVIREISPRVVLRLSPAVKPDQSQAEVLDYAINDDRIIGTALAMSNVSPKVSVSLLTDDGGAAATARSVGLPYKLIPQTWKRPPEQTTETKKIFALEKDLAVYRAQEPTIAIRDLSEVAPAASERRVVKPLPVATIDELIKRLEAKCPPHDDWSVPEDETKIDGTKVTYEPASSEAVKRYLEEERPKWLAECRAVLAGLHEGRTEWEDDLILSFGISNVGNRPAINMRVTFEARGDVLIKRPSKVEDVVQVTKKREPVRPCPGLPKPPRPPEPTRTVIQRPKPSFKLDPSVLPISREKALLAAQNLSSFSRAKELGIFGGTNQSAIDRMLRRDRAKEFGLLGSRHQSAIERILDSESTVGRLMREHGKLNGLGSQFADGTDPFFSGRDYLSHSITPLYLPPKHDPEAFYADDWDRYAPSKRGAYVCDLFRHRGEEEPFDVELFFPDEGQTNGVVICSVHAENLTEPVELRIPVSRLINEADLTEQAEKLVAECAD